MSKPHAKEENAPPHLLSTYAHLIGDEDASLLPISDTFWAEVMEGKHPELDHGRLVSQFEFKESWTTWECHPHGDELVILLSGKVEMLLQEEGGVKRARLTEPGQFVRIPKGVWHTAHPDGGCSMLFITPGRGTQHRPI